MNRKRPTVADLKARKGKGQMTMLRYFTLDEAAAAEAAGIDIASVPPALVSGPRYRVAAPSVFSYARAGGCGFHRQYPVDERPLRHSGSGHLTGRKGAMARLTRNAAQAHMADRVRVNAINLGWVATEGEHRTPAEVLGRGPDWLAKKQAGLPLGRLVTAEETARLAIYLLGEASVPMSGAIIDFEQKVAGAI